MKMAGAVASLNVLMIGTGEYTTGYVHGGAADSDKSAGVVALTMFDLRRLGAVSRIGLCGTNGNKMPGIRAHMKKAIAETYSGMDVSCETFPQDGKIDRKAYLEALSTFKRGDAVCIFVPDDLHFEIALAAIERGLHVMVCCIIYYLLVIYPFSSLSFFSGIVDKTAVQDTRTSYQTVEGCKAAQRARCRGGA